MKLRAIILAFLFGASVAAPAASITFNEGVVNTSNASGPEWVIATSMFLNLIDDYVGSPLGPTGGKASAQSGIDLFDPGGGGLNIALLTWAFSPLTLYQGPGSLTTSPGPASPGAEDYRYDDDGGNAPFNLSFFYDGTLWAEGYATRLVGEVLNNQDLDATGWGNAYLSSHTLDGAAFFAEVMQLTSNTGAIAFAIDAFNSVSPFDPGTFATSGSISFVPEPSTWAMFLGVLTLGACWARRRRG